MMSLHGKVAIITGASSGIGRATARLFAREGASVVLTARGVDALESVAEEIRRDGGQAAAIPGDVTLADTHVRLVETALKRFGRLDIAINNAGTVGQIAPLADLDPDSWHAVLSGNLTSAFLAARVQILAMLESGSGALVFVSSFVGTSVGLPGMAAYGAAKAGLMGLVKGITADYAAVGVRANALLP
ncbi:MAG: SDR family NAD(P)-dependent oxidoreductase, partial [Pseudomonadota bacterium]|nr:SDR family NAD(P)-dependent oxidoreductase [Pseudomonadota bacterium]